MRQLTRGFGFLTRYAAGLLGCAGSRDDVAANTTTAVPAAAVAQDARAAEQAIRAQETRWSDVLARRDTAAIASFYTEDGIYSPSGAPLYRGRTAVSKRWTEELGPGFALERTPLRIDVAASGDLATEVGTYVVRFPGEAGGLYEAAGTYTTSGRKVGDGWQAAADMWNRDAEGPLRRIKRPQG